MKDFFVSYCWEDKDIVEPLVEYLKRNGISVWLDKRETGPGDFLSQRIREALDGCHTVLLMWSKNARASRWCRDEPRAALAMGKRVIPVRLDKTPLLQEYDDILYLKVEQLNTGFAQLLEILQRPYIPRTRPVRNVPYGRNPNFTGRKEHLQEIRNALQRSGKAAITAVSGLGGIGKTQLAAQYALEHQSEYTLVGWLRSEGQITLGIDFANLAEELDLPQKKNPDQNVVIQSVLHWLEKASNWLLIFDNAPDLSKIRPYLPNNPQGHILITSRNSAWSGVAHLIHVKEWQRPESIEFMLKRTTYSDENGAGRIAELLGDLPLAMEQAGAFIEITGMSFIDYEQCFQKQRAELLDRGELSTEYPDTVATTWQMAFREINKESKAAITFLELCSFMAPEEIYFDELREKLVQTSRGRIADYLLKAVSILGHDVTNLPIGGVAPAKLIKICKDNVLFYEMLSWLRRYSLVTFTQNNLTVHRLVQAVVHDRLNEQQQSEWAEVAVRLIAKLFPNNAYDVRFWPSCQRWLTHALMTTRHAEAKKVALSRVRLLLNQVGLYFNSRGAYKEAIPFHQRALEIAEKQHGPEHTSVATSLNNLAESLSALGDYTSAIPLHQRSLEIEEKQRGPEHTSVTNSLNNLAGIYQAQGNYSAALPLFQRALEIEKKQNGIEAPSVAILLTNIAGLYHDQSDYVAALALIQEALEIFEMQFGPDHPHVAQSLNTLASILRDQGDFDSAKSLFQRSLIIREKQLGLHHPDVAESLNNLAMIYQAQGDYPASLPLFQRALEIWEKLLGPKHPKVATGLNNLAMSLGNQGDYPAALPLFQRALEIWEKQFGPEYHQVGTALNNLALLHYNQGDYPAALPLFQKALSIMEKALGQDHPSTQLCHRNLDHTKELAKTS